MKKIYNLFGRKLTQVAVSFCLGFLLAVTVNLGVGLPLLPLSAQSVRPEAAATQAQQQLSFLSLENEYIGRESGEPSSNNTLLLRLIRYHEYVKSRPLNHRFDWQLTFADYFGINEQIKANRYPGHRTLVENPLEGDRQVVTSLTRDQRNQVINSLLAVYGTKSPDKNPIATPSNIEEPEIEEPEVDSSKPQFPQRGSADLLKTLPKEN